MKLNPRSWYPDSNVGLGQGNINFAIKSHGWLIHLERCNNGCRQLQMYGDRWINQNQLLAQKYAKLSSQNTYGEVCS